MKKFYAVATSVILLNGCQSSAELLGVKDYKLPSGQPSAQLQVEMPTLKQSETQMDETGFLNIYHENDPEMKNRFGVFRIKAVAKQGTFVIPAGNKILFKAFENVHEPVKLTSCTVDVPPTEIKVNGQYKIRFIYDPTQKQCEATISEVDRSGNSVVVLGIYSGKAETAGVYIDPVMLPHR